MLKEKLMPTVWPSYLWSYGLIVMLVPALMADAQGKAKHHDLVHLSHHSLQILWLALNGIRTMSRKEVP